MVEILTHPAAVLAQVAERGPAPSVVELLTHPAALGVVAPLVLAALVGIVAIIAVNWSKVRRAEFDATLKHDMLQRGMTADEIERVLGRRNPRRAGRRLIWRWMPRRPGWRR